MQLTTNSLMVCFRVTAMTVMAQLREKSVTQTVLKPLLPQIEAAVSFSAAKVQVRLAHPLPREPTRGCGL